MTHYKLVLVEPTRDDLIQYLLATRGQSEGATADAILAMIAAAPAVQAEPVAYISHTSEETINTVISLVKDAAAAHLNSEFNECLSKIRYLLTAAHRKQGGEP